MVAGRIEVRFPLVLRRPWKLLRSATPRGGGDRLRNPGAPAARRLRRDGEQHAPVDVEHDAPRQPLRIAIHVLDAEGMIWSPRLKHVEDDADDARDAEKPGPLRGRASAFAATPEGGGDAGSTYSVDPASSTGGVSGGTTLAPCSNTTSPSRTSTMIVSPARNSL